MPGGGNLTSRHPLRLNVGFLLHESVGFSRNFVFDHAAVLVGGDLQVEDLRGTVRFTRTAQGLYAHGRLHARAHQTCVRCLAEYEQDLSVELDDLFTYPPAPGADALLQIPESGILDLNPLLREHLLLAVPLQPLCRPDCAGLCPVCGANQNLTHCHHRETAIDPRLAVLKSLLSEE